MTNRSIARKIRAQSKNVAIYKILDLSNLLKPCLYLALKLVPSLTGLRTVDSIGKQEFGRLLQNSNWTLHYCVKAVSFANTDCNCKASLSHRPLSLLVSPLHPILQLPFIVPKLYIYTYIHTYVSNCNKKEKTRVWALQRFESFLSRQMLI